MSVAPLGSTIVMTKHLFTILMNIIHLLEKTSFDIFGIQKTQQKQMTEFKHAMANKLDICPTQVK